MTVYRVPLLFSHSGSVCNMLTHLDVSWCAVGDEGLIAIAQGCPGLKELKLTGCLDVTSRGVGYIASRATGLLLLNLSHCRQVSRFA